MDLDVRKPVFGMKIIHNEGFTVDELIAFKVHYMGLNARKPVFRVSDKANFKPDSSATETS